MIKTFKELQEIDELVGGLYAEDDKIKLSKFGYAYKRFSDKNYVPLLKEFQQELYDIRIEDALEDEKTKEILVDKTNYRGFKYSKDGLKRVVIAERNLALKFDKKEVEVIPFISTYVPEGLPEEVIEQLTGIIL